MATLKYSTNSRCLYLENDPKEHIFYKGSICPTRDCLLHDHENRENTKSIFKLFCVRFEEVEGKYGNITIAENINPFICYINFRLVVYFGEDAPILKCNSVKSCTKHYKFWTLHEWKNPKEIEQYYYLEVKEPEKLFVFGNTYHFEDWAQERCHETLEDFNRQYICRYDMPKYSFDYKLKNKLERDLELKREREEYERELEERKNTPGYCSKCGAEHAVWTINPFLAEIYGDYTQLWLCDDCYNDLLGDI